MNQPPKGSTSHNGLNAAFDAEQARKSTLVAEAQSLLTQGQLDAATARFAEAAEIEERLAGICREHGLMEQAFSHQFSAAGCWAQAGNWFDAVNWCEELIADPDIPERLRQRVQEYADMLRSHLAERSARLAEVEFGDSAD